MIVDSYHTISQEEVANPLLHYKRLIPFDIIEPDHFFPALDSLIQTLLPEIEALETLTSPTWDTLILPLEEIEEKIHRTTGPMHHLKMVKDSPKLREVWEKVEPIIHKLQRRIKQSRTLYEHFRTIKEGPEWHTLTPPQQRSLNIRLKEAKLKGIDLDEEELRHFNSLFDRLKRLQSQYKANLLDATKSFSIIVEEKKKLEGVPYSILKLTSDSYNLTKNEEDPPSTPLEGPWKLSLMTTVYSSISNHCKHRKTREMMYRAHISKASSGASSNTENILEQLKIRKKLAQMLGYNTFAELSIASKIAPNVDTVLDFLNNLRDASWTAGREDLLETQLFAAKNGFREPMMPWDFSYWSERLKENRYHLSEAKIKPYFPLKKALRGLFDLCHTLFGVTIVKPEQQPPCWDPSVTYYVVYDESGEQIASFYLDPFLRPQSKRGGAWTDTCLNRTFLNGKLQLPMTYIGCNSMPPVGEAPALLTFSELKTLFHEFGHALQHMLSKVNIGNISGNNGIEWDAIEIPSKFMENWCYHKPTLQTLTEHYETGEPLPEVLMDKIISARTYNAGLNMLSQLKYSISDLHIHHDYDPHSTLTPFDAYFETCLSTSHLPCLDDDRFLCSFHHLFGGDSYAAGYYSYKWAEVLSADAFEAFLEVEEDWQALRTVGQAFKRTFLELGGSAHPLEVFEAFRGREPIIAPLLKHSGFKEK
ncbi:MAG: M3 family metallopeptidase [Chlamydiales bacterium]|nr:M3 family metallopeptidase [Chlamydiales bacterium]